MQVNFMLLANQVNSIINSFVNTSHSNGDNLCELEDSDDEVTLGGGNNGNKRNSGVNPRVTSV